MTLDAAPMSEEAPDPGAGGGNAVAEIAAPAVAGTGLRQGEECEHERLARWSDPRRTLNIADELDETELVKIGHRADREYKIDVVSRDSWMKQSRDAIDLAMQVAKEKSYPWPKASNIIYPLMTTAAIEFAARAYPAIVAGRDVVKGVVYGPDDGIPKMTMGPNGPMPQPMMGPQGQPAMDPQTGAPQIDWQVPPGARRARAARIGEHMSFQLLEEMPEWEEETDRMLHILPIVGCAFRKSYFDPQWARNMSLMVTAENVVINYRAKSVELAPRISEEMELYPLEIEEAIRAETFTDQKYAVSADSNPGDDDAPRDFVEQHRWIDLDEDGYPEPYIVTYHKPSAKVARIVARFDPEGVHFSKRDNRIVKIEPVQYYTKYDFLPNIEGGIYGMGFGQLLNPINAGVNSSLNMLIDAAHRRNAGGGFIGRGLNMHGGSVRFKMGEYVPVNSTGAQIRDAIVSLEAPGADPVLFQLLGMLIQAGKDVAAAKDVLSGELAAQTMQPTTLLALIEQGLQVFTAIFKRYWRAEKHELAKLYRLNRVYLNDQAGYQIGDTWKKITREDYARGDGVQPIADPNMVSSMQRLAQANVLDGYKNDPLCDPIEIRHRIFDAARIEGADRIIAKQVPPPPPDQAVELAKLQLANEHLKTLSRASVERVDEILKRTQAVNQLAQADKAAGSNFIEWTRTQLEGVRIELERLSAGADAGTTAAAAPADGAGNDGAGLQGLAPQPGNQMVPAVPQGLPG